MSRGAEMRAALEEKRIIREDRDAKHRESALRWYPEQTVSDIATRLGRDERTVARWVGASKAAYPVVGETWRVKGEPEKVATVVEMTKKRLGNHRPELRARHPRDADDHGAGDDMTTRMTEPGLWAARLNAVRPDLSERDRKAAVALLSDEVMRARSEEARLTEEAKAKDERIKELEDALRAGIAGFDKIIRLAKVSP